jgi:hypothetical protein
MLRVLLGGLVGAIILFIWGFLAWVVFQIHDATVRALPDEPRFVELMRDADVRTGTYFFPAMEGSWSDHRAMTEEERQASRESWRQAHIRGPVGVLHYNADGWPPESPLSFGIGFALYLAAAFFASAMLSAAAPKLRTYFARVLFVAGFGLIVAAFNDLSMWNWLHVPLDFSAMQALDHVLGWTFAGLGIAAVVRA